MKKWGKKKKIFAVSAIVLITGILSALCIYICYDNCLFSSSCESIGESYLRSLLLKEENYREDNLLNPDNVETFYYREQLNDVVTEADINNAYFTTYFDVYQSKEYINSINENIYSVKYKQNGYYSFSASRCCKANRFSFKYEMEEQGETSIGIRYVEVTFEKHYITDLHILNTSENITIKTDLTLTLK